MLDDFHVGRLPQREGQIHRINAARHRFDGLEAIESMPGCIDSMDLTPHGPGPALVIFFRRARQGVALFSTAPLERLPSERPIPIKVVLEKSHESTSDPLKAWFRGGVPPALPLERTRNTRGVQKLISNTRTEACALHSPEGDPSGERPPPRRGVALFALCKRGRARGASSRGHHQ